ncbi:MAG: DUF4124 domain-containing protein, partial [Thioalkalispiraceae bacterium]
MKDFIKICIATGLSLLVSTAFVSTTAQAAGMYKWTDEQGNVHYSQHPPRDKQYEKMKVDRGKPRYGSQSSTSSSSPAPSTGQASGQ